MIDIGDYEPDYIREEIDKKIINRILSYHTDLENKAYELIKDFYGKKTANRSGVPLINHIDEGVKLMKYLNHDSAAIRAFILHPLFQRTEEFLSVGREVCQELNDSLAIALAVEYRNVANKYLSESDYKYNILSDIPEVNQMLIADKVQNRKDFEKHHLLTHLDSTNLVRYFNDWMVALRISKKQYREYVEVMELNNGI